MQVERVDLPKGEISLLDNWKVDIHNFCWKYCVYASISVFSIKKTLEKGGFQAIWGFWAFPRYIALPTFPLIKTWRFLGRLWLFCPPGRKLQQQVLYDNPF